MRSSKESFSGWTTTFTDPRPCATIVDRLTFGGNIIGTATTSCRSTTPERDAPPRCTRAATTDRLPSQRCGIVDRIRGRPDRSVKGDTMFLGLRTVIYPASDLAASKAWYSQLLGVEPFFDEPFYVGFSVEGYELALDPSGDPAAGPVTYWGVADAVAALAQLLDAGAAPRGQVLDVGDGIRVATVLEPGGAILGVIENPHFQLPDSATPPAGPGR